MSVIIRRHASATDLKPLCIQLALSLVLVFALVVQVKKGSQGAVKTVEQDLPHISCGHRLMPANACPPASNLYS